MTTASEETNGGVPSSARSWQVPAICVLLVILVFAVFGRAVGHGFVNYDDNRYVYEKPIVSRGLSLEGIRWAFTGSDLQLWHPLTTISHMLDCQLYGLWAGGHHLTNVILHAACAVLLFIALLKLTSALWRCAFIAALFAIHPLRVESVAWIAERKDVLSGLFFMLTLWAYAQYTRRPGGWRHYAMVVLWLALGLMSKPVLVTVPFVLLLLDYWPLERFKPGSKIGTLLIEKLPLFVLSGLTCVITILTHTGDAGLVEHPTLSHKIASAFVACVIYLSKLVYPVNLAVFYPIPQNGWPVWQVIASIILLAAVTACALALRRSRPYLLVGWFWYLGMLAPVIGILSAGRAEYADRYTYLPQIGLCLAGTWTVADLTQAWQHRRILLGSVAASLISVLSLLAWHQTACWRDSLTLWTHTLDSTRDNYVALNNLGRVMYSRKQFKDAEADYDKAIQINPACIEARLNYADLLREEGRTDEAITQFRKACETNPPSTTARCDLGNLMLDQGRPNEAITQFQDALRINPGFPEAHYNLGIAYLQQNRIAEAAAQFQEALRLNPTYADASVNLGITFMQQGRAADGIAQFRAASRMDPGNAAACDNLGKALLMQGQNDEAIAQFYNSLRLNPSNAEAHDQFGVLLLRLGRKDEAIVQFRDLVKLRPSADAHMRLGYALTQAGQTSEAINETEEALELQPANLSIMATLSWTLATAPQAALRNGPKALDLATKVNQATGGANPIILRTLAAAYAETGQYPNAIKTAQQALTLIQTQPNPTLASELTRELNLYQSGHPFQDTR